MSDNEILELLFTPAEYTIEESEELAGYADYHMLSNRPSNNLDYLGEKDEWN